MLFRSPACAVICTIIRNAINRRLEKKNLPVDLACYRDIDHLDADTLKPVYKTEESPVSKEPFTSYTRSRQKKTDASQFSHLQRIFNEINTPEEKKNASDCEQSQNITRDKDELL